MMRVVWATQFWIVEVFRIIIHISEVDRKPLQFFDKDAGISRKQSEMFGRNAKHSAKKGVKDL